uniref:Origin recognition complex subunit 2 n=1 Tax=Timema poppense TaxID=170557 RepID=A0A7R9CNN1_TIMPO|nr:unnamed protein product [Timema poppensis]
METRKKCFKYVYDSSEEDSVENCRVSTRKNKNKIYTKNTISEDKNEDTEDEDKDGPEEGIEDKENHEDSVGYKPTGLFEKGNISGPNVFGFRTPKKKNAMAEKAAISASMVSTPSPGSSSRNKHSTPKSYTLSPKTPQTPRTPRLSSVIQSSRSLNTPQTPHTPQRIGVPLETIANTPYNLRRRFKSAISRMAACQEDDVSDISVSGSEYNLSSDEGDSSSERSGDKEDDRSSEGSRGSDSSSCLGNLGTTSVSTRSRAVDRAPLTSTKKRRKDISSVPEMEDYFSRSSSKSVTSNHTLNRLKTPRLAQGRLQHLLGKIEPSHKNAINSLCKEHESQFHKWMLALREGFSVILYGVGSKRILLQRFQDECLQDKPVLMVNGFFPSLTIKEMLDSITDDILELEDCPVNVHECIDRIESEFRSDPQLELYFIVHNIDGPTLHTHKNQEILSRLARVDNIHLVASVDHINAPLIWDQKKLSRFNFLWWDVTSLLPYTSETSFETSMLVQHSGAVALASLRNVFQSLTSNARQIFLIVAKYQLNNKSNSNYTGLPFRDLYWQCRESLLVSSDLALRAQLTEFLDHHLVKCRRSIDGSELLNIPVDHATLTQFVDQQEK